VTLTAYTDSEFDRQRGNAARKVKVKKPSPLKTEVRHPTAYFTVRFFIRLEGRFAFVFLREGAQR